MNHFYVDRKRQERKRKLKSYMHKRKTAHHGPSRRRKASPPGAAGSGEIRTGPQMNHMVEPIAGAPFKARSSWFWM